MAAKDGSEGKDIKPVIDKLRSVSPDEVRHKGRGAAIEGSSSASRDPVEADRVTGPEAEAPAESSGSVVKDTVTEASLNDTPADEPSTIMAETDTESAPPTLNGVEQASSLPVPKTISGAEPDKQPTQPAQSTQTAQVSHTRIVTDSDPDNLDPNPSLSQISSSSQPAPASARRARTAAATSASRKTKLNFHVRPDLLPVTRFHQDELEGHWKKLLELVLDQEMTREDRARWFSLDEGDGDLMDKVEEYIRNRKHRRTSSDTTKDSHANDSLNDSHGDTSGVIRVEPELEVNKYYTRSTTSHDPSVKPIPDPAGLEDQTHPFMLVQAEELDNALFDHLWSKGEPMVVNGIGERFKQSWTPDTFINRFGTEDCRESIQVKV